MQNLHAVSQIVSEIYAFEVFGVISGTKVTKKVKMASRSESNRPNRMRFVASDVKLNEESEFSIESCLGGPQIPPSHPNAQIFTLKCAMFRSADGGDGNPNFYFSGL